MNKEKAQEIIQWYGYPKVKFEKQTDDNTFFFRTDNPIGEQNFVLKVVFSQEGIVIYCAYDDPFERYDVDCYDFGFDASFTFAELKENIKNRLRNS